MDGEDDDRTVVPARRGSVQSLERALDLLETLATGGELRLTELAARTGLVPSTAHRLLHTLTARGWVEHTAGSYALGYKVAEVASGFEQRLGRLRALARPHMASVQRATGETVNLAIMDAERVVYVEQVEGTRSVRMFTAVGTTVAAHTTGAGKAIMAHWPPAAVADLYRAGEPLQPLTERTLATVDALVEDLARVRQRGYAIDNEEHELGVACVAAPVFDHAGRPAAAISVSGPSARILGGDHAALGALLVDHARKVSAALGHGTVVSPDPA